MRVRLLGAVAAHHDGVELALGGRKQRAVFALLALNANRVVSVDQLVQEVWPDEPPPQATVALRAYVSRLRRTLSGTDALIRTRPPGWLLQLAEDQVDALRFVQLVTVGGRGADQDTDPAATCRRLGAALALWSGDPLSDLAGLDFARAEAVRLDGLRQEADELLLEARLAAGEREGLVDAARQLVGAYPFRERGWCALMLALYRNGQQSEAIEVYGQLRQLLRDELGLDPSPRARELESQILRQDPVLQPPAPSRNPAEAPLLDVHPLPAPIEPGVRLVGRTETQTQLDESWRQAVAGSGRLLLVEAAAGLGKSAVLHSLVDRIRTSGGLVLEGNGVGDEATPALWPWVTIVRQLLAELPELAAGPSLSGPARLAVATLGADAEPEVTEDARLTQTTLYRGVVDLLLTARRLRPLAVVVDDLQWVDRDSLRLLALVVDQLAPAGVLFAVAVRTEESNVAAIEQLVQTLRRDRVSRIGLGPLPVADVAALATAVAGKPLEAGLVAAVAARTSGNPLFVVELVRLLVAEGQLTEQAVHRALPLGVRDVLRRRIDRLPPDTVVLLGVAALVGPSVLDVELLADVTGLEEEAVLDGCETALLSGLLVEGERPGSFGLSHDLVRQTLVEGLSGARQVRLHVKIAASLQGRPYASAEQVVEIARQLMLATPAVGPAAAIPYLILASEDALSRYAHRSAEATLQSALTLAQTIGDPAQRRMMRMQVTGLLSGLQTLARAAPPALEEPAGTTGALSLSQPTDALSAAGWLGVVINMVNAGRWAWGVTAARQVMARSPTQSAEIVARFVLAWLSYVQGDLDGGAEQLGVLDDMIERGIEVSLPGALSRLPETIAGYGALIAHAQGDEARASELIEVARQRANGTESGLLDVALYTCLLAAMRGDRVAAAASAADSERLSGVVEYPVYAIVTDVVWAWSRGLVGEPGPPIEQAYARYEATGIKSHLTFFLLLRAEVSAAGGDHSRAVALIRESRRISAQLGEVCGSPRLTALADRLLEDEERGCPRR